MEMSHTEAVPGVEVITLSGKLMMGTVGERIVELVTELLAKGRRTIVFDLAGVTTLDSTGIGQFISSYNKIAAAGGELRMSGAGGHIFQTFHVSLLDQVFRFFPTAEEAARG
jgi:anti-sigma B factor antagonist